MDDISDLLWEAEVMMRNRKGVEMWYSAPLSEPERQTDKQRGRGSRRGKMHERDESKNICEEINRNVKKRLRGNENVRK